MVWPDGSTHWLVGRFQVLRDAAGKPLRLTGVNLDITDRKRNEQALRQARDELETRVQERTAELVRLNLRLHSEIKDRKAAQAELQNREEQLRDLFENATASSRASRRTGASSSSTAPGSTRWATA